MSSWYETAPIGGPEQGPYLNAVVVLDTKLSAPALLDGMLDIERASGRTRGEKWGPRTLDLDLLLYGREDIRQPGLTVPHPELLRRRFVLEPLIEAWPDAAMPDDTPVRDSLPSVSDQVVDRYSPLDAAGFPPWAPVALFLVVGLGAVVIWWLLGLVL